MQYFHQFITEIKTLDIRTKVQFVTSDGQTIPSYEIDPATIPEEYTGYGRRVTFLDLHHYRDRGPYPAEIGRLQQLAIKDALCLSPEQLGMQLGYLNQLAEQFSRVIRKIIEFNKGMDAGTLDDPLFLDLQVYPFFTIDSVPEGSVAGRFGDELMEAAGIKRHALTGFIDQTQRVLHESNGMTQSSPATPIAAPEIPPHLQKRINETLNTLDSLNLPPRFWELDLPDFTYCYTAAQDTLQKRLYEKYGQPFDREKPNVLHESEGDCILHPTTPGQAWDYITSWIAPRHLLGLIRDRQQDAFLSTLATEDLKKNEAFLVKANTVDPDEARKFLAYTPSREAGRLVIAKRFMLGCYEQAKHLPGTAYGADADKFTEHFVWPEFLRRYVSEQVRAVKATVDTIPKTIDIREEAISPTYNLLAMQFDEYDRTHLQTVLEGSAIDRKLYFRNNANKLTDVFWRLTHGGTKWIGNTNEQVIAWIAATFQYKGPQGAKDFDAGMLDANISINSKKCRKPLLGASTFLNDLNRS